MLGGFFATNVGHFRFGLLEGWRLAFHFVAFISVLCGLLVLKLATDPRKKVLQHPLHVYFFTHRFAKDRPVLRSGRGRLLPASSWSHTHYS